MINNPGKFFTSLLIFSASLIFYSMFLVWNASALHFKASPEYFILHGASVVFGKVVTIDVVSSKVINEPVSREKEGYTVGERIETGFVVLEVLQNPTQDIKQPIIRIPFERRRFFNPDGEIVSVSKGEPQGFDAINLRPQMTLLIYCKRQGDVYELSQVASNAVQELSEDQLPDFSAIMKKVNRKPKDEFSEHLEVKARLVDAGMFDPNTPDCGGLMYVVTMKYADIEVISGTYPADILYALHICPQDTVRHSKSDSLSFKVGEIHHLKLRKMDVFDERDRAMEQAGSLLGEEPEIPRYKVIEVSALTEVSVLTKDEGLTGKILQSFKVIEEGSDFLIIDIFYRLKGVPDEPQSLISAIPLVDGVSPGHFSVSTAEARIGQGVARIRIGMHGSAPDYCSNEIMMELYHARKSPYETLVMPYEKCWKRSVVYFDEPSNWEKIQKAVKLFFQKKEKIGRWRIRKNPVSAIPMAGSVPSKEWLNVDRYALSLNDALTGYRLTDTGFSNLETGVVIDFHFTENSVRNGREADLVLLEARFDAGEYRISTDYDGFTSSYVIGAGDFVDTGEERSYFYGAYGNRGPFKSRVFASPIDLSDLGVPNDKTISIVRITIMGKGCDLLGLGALNPVSGPPYGLLFFGAVFICAGIVVVVIVWWRRSVH